MKTCSKCSISYPDEKKFCKNCGSPLVSESKLNLKDVAQVYEWTGISKFTIKSKSLEITFIIGIAVVVAMLYLAFTTFPGGDAANWIGADGGALINKMAPEYLIHIGNWIMAGFLAFLLIINIFNMWYKTILSRKGMKVPFSAYFTSIFSLFGSFFTQSRFTRSNEDSRSYRYIDFFLTMSYLMLFTMIVFFLFWFQTDTVYPIWHPQRLLGYIATIGLFVGIVYFINNRFKKMKNNSKYSNYADWTFLVLLLLTTTTGILMHFFRIFGMPAATYITYLIHLMVLVPMLIFGVSFSKWSYHTYKPFAVYFAKVISKTKKNHTVV
jgi:quinone-modifying oxidoreductase, subunit QmoC